MNFKMTQKEYDALPKEEKEKLDAEWYDTMGFLADCAEGKRNILERYQVADDDTHST
jgi:hypothetical protein